MHSKSKHLLEIRDLNVRFYTYQGILDAVDIDSLTLDKRQSLGLVGETGCGKSVTSLAILGLIPYPGKIERGVIMFDGEDLLQKSKEEMQAIRGGRISMIFQNPVSSLNPVFTIGDQIGSVIRLHQGIDSKEAHRRAVEMLSLVQLSDPDKIVSAYPHELSGGMCQRVMIAMALACNPDLLIADEPTTALDVTIQAQILKLMKGLRERLQTSILLITHDLSVVAQTCDRVAVMYAGNKVEYGPARDVFKTPKHPYTQGLLKAIPKMGTTRARLEGIEGAVPSMLDPPPGCRFHPRCPYAKVKCSAERPRSVELENKHAVSCVLYYQ
jgi:oligopeptide/dipeptide ABC transporter ATP-binding protein